MAAKEDDGPAVGASPESKARQRKTTMIVFVNVMLYAVAFQLQRPIEPFLVKRLGADDGSYGRLQSFFSLVQTLGSPAVGTVLDLVGARAMFVVVFASSACSYAILAKATTIGWLYASKIPTLFQAGFLVAQALVSSSTRGSAAERAAALGRLTTAYTVGATLGPAAGGFFGAQGDYYVGAKLAVGLSLFSALLALALPQDSRGRGQVRDVVSAQPATKKNNNGGGSESKTKKHDNKKHSRMAVARIALKTWPWLAAKACTGVTNSILGTTIPLFLRDRGFDEGRLGLAMAGSSAVVALVGAFLLGPATARFGPNLPGLSLFAKSLNVALMSLCANSTSLTVLAVVVTLHHAVSHVLATSLTTATTGLISPAEQGALLGLEHALFAIARIFGPTIGTTLKAFFGDGIASLAAICAFADGLLAVAFGSWVAGSGRAPTTSSSS